MYLKIYSFSGGNADGGLIVKDIIEIKHIRQNPIFSTLAMQKYIGKKYLQSKNYSQLNTLELYYEFISMYTDGRFGNNCVKYQSLNYYFNKYNCIIMFFIKIIF